VFLQRQPDIDDIPPNIDSRPFRLCLVRIRTGQDDIIDGIRSFAWSEVISQEIYPTRQIVYPRRMMRHLDRLPIIGCKIRPGDFPLLQSFEAFGDGEGRGGVVFDAGDLALEGVLEDGGVREDGMEEGRGMEAGDEVAEGEVGEDVDDELFGQMEQHPVVVVTCHWSTCTATFDIRYECAV
jgi:hypothetical protein